MTSPQDTPDTSGRTFHPVVWAPSAIKDAVEHAAEAFKAADGAIARVSTFELSALIDATRTLIKHNEWAAAMPKVVCLSGSMRFEEHMRSVAVDLSLEGTIVTGPFVNMKKTDPRWATDELADPIKVALDGLHFRKIDLADEIVVVSDESGYVGESTANEIEYARRAGKPVRHVRIALPLEAPQADAGRFDERVAATIRTAVDEWRIHNDPADPHGVSMQEYIRSALADAGLLASLRWEQLTAEVERLKDVDAEAFGVRFQVQSLDIVLGHIARVMTRLLTDANISSFPKRLPHLAYRVEEEFQAVVRQRDEALAALEKQQAMLSGVALIPEDARSEIRDVISNPALRKLRRKRDGGQQETFASWGARAVLDLLASWGVRRATSELPDPVACAQVHLRGDA